MNATSIDSERNIKLANSRPTRIYEFDRFRLDAVHLMLYENERPVALAPKVVETLLALIESRGEVVSKDELMDKLWADTFVEESNLTQNIYRIRKTLGKGRNGQQLVESFKRRGYRFNGEIREAGEIELLVATHSKTLTVTEEETSPEVTTAIDFARIHSASPLAKLFIAGIALLGILTLAYGISRFYNPESKAVQTKDSAALIPAIKMTRLTPDQNIGDMAISPDGKYLAYAVVEKGKNSLWLKDIASGSTTQIMPSVDNGLYGNLNFFPDGSQIYYNSRPNTSVNYTLSRIPVFGGESQKIAQNVISPITFSPNGGQIAFVRWKQAEGRLIIANADGSGERIVSRRGGISGYETWGSNLSWSPDGQKIAVCGAKILGNSRRYELIEVSVTDGTERNIPIPDWNYLDDVVWLSDQSGLLVRARETEVSPWQIWRVSYPNGEIGRITNDTNNYDDLSLSADSRILITKQQFGNLNLWTEPFEDTGNPKQITFGNAASDGAYGVSFTPNGKIIYTSPRSGNVDLWVTNANGTEQKQLTKNAGEFNGSPRVTPDGNTIVFVSTRSGSRQIWRMDLDGGNPQRLSDEKMADQPYLSPDGEWIYFTLYQEEGQIIIARIPTIGGQIVPVYEKNNPFLASVSPDGRQMLFDFYEEGSAQPWKTGLLSLETSELKVIMENGFGRGWTADSKSMIFARGNPSNLWEVSIDGGKPHQLTHFESGEIRTFVISHDFKQIAFARGNPSVEAVLISDF